MVGRDGGVRTKNTNNVNNTNKFKGSQPLFPFYSYFDFILKAHHCMDIKSIANFSSKLTTMNDYNMTNSGNPIKENQKIFKRDGTGWGKTKSYLNLCRVLKTFKIRLELFYFYCKPFP